MCPSKTSVESMHLYFSSKQDEFDRIFCYGTSNNVKKNIHFLKNNDKAVVFMQSNFANCISTNKIDIDVFILLKIPFDAPNDQVIECRSSYYKNKFKDDSLAKAIMRISHPVWHIKAKMHYTLDSRTPASWASDFYKI